MERPSLAGVLREYGVAYRRRHALSPAQARARRSILDCRTRALGGVIERCEACGAQRHRYRSCRNRHCPQCQTRAKEAWRAARLAEVLPVPYAHWVFTLPHALNALAGRHPRWLYNALFDCAAATLSELAANPRWLGAVPAFSLVLHTWTQDLRTHLHVHALVACGGLDAQGQWRQPPRGHGFLFPVQAASKLFRAKFLAALDQGRQHGEIPDDPHAEPGPWQARRRQLLAHDWVVYAKPPPGGPAQVLDYLARYTHRVAISNERILGCDDGTVRLRVRDNHNGGKRTLRLPAEQFIGRFLQHVLPPGFKRIRHYGLLAPGRKSVRLAAARAALETPEPQPAAIEAAEQFLARVAGAEACRCPHCGRGRWVHIGILPAPARSARKPTPRCRHGPP